MSAIKKDKIFFKNIKMSLQEISKITSRNCSFECDVGSVLSLLELFLDCLRVCLLVGQEAGSSRLCAG